VGGLGGKGSRTSITVSIMFTESLYHVHSFVFKERCYDCSGVGADPWLCSEEPRGCWH
jgi:hypothetical protein